MPDKQAILTDKAMAPLPVFSQAVVHGGMIYCSGSIGIDPSTREIVPGPVGQRTAQALRNLAAVLQAGGSDLKNVVKVNVFLTSMTDFADMNQAYESFFSDGVKPCRTCVAVKELPFGTDVEIECTAFLSGSNGKEHGLFYAATKIEYPDRTYGCYQNPEHNQNDNICGANSNAYIWSDAGWYTAPDGLYTYPIIDHSYDDYHYEFYIQTTGHFERGVPGMTTEGFRLRAEAPEFIPSGQTFSVNDFDAVSYGDITTESDVAPTDVMTQHPAQKRYVTV
ncbi:hypothetical protein LOZ58_006495 [Ophidiomyces ophidiicola]|nr:hypothetical protein LOZ58_006495 [Ophidiomyces ophidiicola]